MSDIYDHYPRIIASSGPQIVVMEIGCGRAEDTGRMVGHVIGTGKPYRFYTFEPEAKNIPTIIEKVGSRVNVVAAAVGDKNARVSFIGSGSWPFSGSVKNPKEHLTNYPWIPWEQPVEVQMIRLDDFMAAHLLDHIDFIWADTQGAEDIVIAGAQIALRRTRYFYTEYYNTEEYEGQIPLAEIHRRLPGRWDIEATWPDNVLFRNVDFVP